MNSIIKKLIEIAKSFVGYLEKATNAELEDFTANAGSGNWTIFGQWYGLNGQPWCAEFVSYCADKAGIPTTVIPKHASCSMGVNWFKTAGRWHKPAGYIPQPGDIIYFSYDGTSPAHVGIVWNTDKSRVYTIEGNTSGGSEFIANGGGVSMKSYPLTYVKILGYGNPAYPMEADAAQIPTVILKIGNKGADVKALQTRLNSLKFPCGSVDGDFGKRTLEAVKAFQAARGLVVDGEVGPKTWAALMA